MEKGEIFCIQVVGKCFSVLCDVELIIEHEVEDGAEELSLELKWQSRDAGE